MRCASNASGDRLKRICCNVANCGCFAHAGLAMRIALAVKRGHGSQRDKPLASGLRCQCTERSPSMTNARPIASLTLASIQGLARFQSNNARNRYATSSKATSTPATPSIMRLARFIAARLHKPCEPSVRASSRRSCPRTCSRARLLAK